MKKIVSIVMLMMCVATVSAQWSVTPEAGMTAVKRNEYGSEGWQAGWKMGVGLEYQFKPGLFSLKSGLYYTQRGQTSHFLSFGMSSLTDRHNEMTWRNYSVNRHFLQVPILANFSFSMGKDVRLNVGVGPYLGVSLADRREYAAFSCGEDFGNGNGYGGGYYSDYYQTSYGRDLRSFDWGLNANVGLEVKQWVMNLGYEVSLGQEYDRQNFQANYHSLSLSIGYKFKLGK